MLFSDSRSRRSACSPVPLRSWRTDEDCSTGDTRESPAITIVKHFRDENAKITVYDPKVPEAQIWLDLTEPGVQDDLAAGASLPAPDSAETDVRTAKSQVTICRSALEACLGSDAIVVCTEVRPCPSLPSETATDAGSQWDEFKTIDWQKIYDAAPKPSYVFDGRGILDAPMLEAIGFKVVSIGRGVAE